MEQIEGGGRVVRMLNNQNAQKQSRTSVSCLIAARFVESVSTPESVSSRRVSAALAIGDWGQGLGNLCT